MPRYAAKVDVNQGAIVDALRAAGASVEVLGLPLDLLVGAGGQWAIVEVKRDAAAVRRKSATRERQMAFADRHPSGGVIATVTDVEGALMVVALLRGQVSPAVPA